MNNDIVKIEIIKILKEKDIHIKELEKLLDEIKELYELMAKQSATDSIPF